MDLSILYYGAPRACPDILHATGFAASDPLILLVHPNGALDLVVSILELGRATRQVPNATVWSHESLGLPISARTSEQIAALLQKRHLKDVAVPSTFPLGIGTELDQAGFNLHLRPARGLRQQRLIKSPAELKFLRAAQRAAVQGMLCARDLIQAAEIGPRGTLYLNAKPLTAERIRQAMRETIVPLGFIDEDTIVAPGDQATDPHEMGHGPIHAGEFIVIDFFPRSLESGYWGDLTRTYWRGPLSPNQIRLYKTVRKIQAETKKRILPGADGAAIHQAVCDFFLAAGYTNGSHNGKPTGYFHGTGHGVGLEIHEEPTLGRSPSILLENMVVTNEPGLYYPGLGGVRIEDTVVVTPKGGVPLASCPIP